MNRASTYADIDPNSIVTISAPNTTITELKKKLPIPAVVQAFR